MQCVYAKSTPVAAKLRTRPRCDLQHDLPLRRDPVRLPEAVSEDSREALLAEITKIVNQGLSSVDDRVMRNFTERMRHANVDTK